MTNATGVPVRAKKPPKAPKPKKAPEPAKDWTQLPSFDMAIKPCVPVALLGERTPTKLSLMSVLEKAESIADILSPSPSVYLGLMRLFTALAQRIDGPKNDADRERLIREWIDEEKLARYSDKALKSGWFDLFHATRPFFQVDPLLVSDATSDMSFNRLRPVSDQSVAKLTLTRSAGKEKAHFDKSFDDDPKPISSAEVGLELVGYQSCSMGGSNGGNLDEQGDVARPFLVNSNGPGSIGVNVVLKGDNLAQTLALNTLTPEFAKQVVSATADGPDAPSWEEPPSGRAVWNELSAGWRGPMDFLTLHTKRVLLRPKLGEDGQPALDVDGHAIINRCLIRSGRGSTFKGRKPAGAPVMNPWCAYVHKKDFSAPVGRYSSQHEPVWVTGLRILASGPDRRRPLVIDQAAKLGLPCKTLRMRLVGVHHPPGLTGCSIVAFSENEEVEFPVALLDGARVARTLEALEEALFGVIVAITKINLEVDFNGDEHTNAKKSSRDWAKDDPAVTYFWEVVREHAINGATDDLATDDKWRARLWKLAHEATEYHVSRRDTSVETVVGIAKALNGSDETNAKKESK